MARLRLNRGGTPLPRKPPTGAAPTKVFETASRHFVSDRDFGGGTTSDEADNAVRLVPSHRRGSRQRVVSRTESRRHPMQNRPVATLQAVHPRPVLKGYCRARSATSTALDLPVATFCFGLVGQGRQRLAAVRLRMGCHRPEFTEPIRPRHGKTASGRTVTHV